MVQSVENQTRISGKVVARRPHPSLDGYDILTLELERAEPVPGKANLLESLLGGVVDLTVRRPLLGSAGPGALLHCRAKRTPDGAMCESHPDPSDFQLLEPESLG